MLKRLRTVPRQTLIRVGSSFLLGVVIGSVVTYTVKVNAALPVSRSLRLSDPEHKLISPLLLADSGRPADRSITDKLKVETYDLLNIPNMQTISIYFRDLKTGIWAGVGEDTEYDPASLLKVPVMIAWYKKAEENPNVLYKTLLYTGHDLDSSLQTGGTYTVRDLIKIMITKSDNAAKDLLLSELDDATINSVFSDLGIETWGSEPGSSEHISPAIYSRFLRILYNASYINRDYSQEALELLSHTDFNAGIVAGVPEGTTVAHKYGSYGSEEERVVELHDCGIVYHPTHPYLLCVMTRGTVGVGASTLENVIKTTSETIYKLVDQELAK